MSDLTGNIHSCICNFENDSEADIMQNPGGKTVLQSEQVDPLSNTAVRRYTVLASIAMKNIIEIHCSISEISEKILKFGY